MQIPHHEQDPPLAAASAIWKMAAVWVVPRQVEVITEISSLAEVLIMLATREEPSKQCTFALRSGLRFLSNAITGCDTNQQKLWEYAYPTLFMRLLEEINERPAFAVVQLTVGCLISRPAVVHHPLQQFCPKRAAFAPAVRRTVTGGRISGTEPMGARRNTFP